MLAPWKKSYDQPAATAAAKSLQSCPTLCDPIDDSPPGSAISGILQTRTLEWFAISFSNAWKWKVKVKSLSHARLFAKWFFLPNYSVPCSLYLDKWYNHWGKRQMGPRLSSWSLCLWTNSPGWREGGAEPCPDKRQRPHISHSQGQEDLPNYTCTERLLGDQKRSDVNLPISLFTRLHLG